jgi:hypothetical protein
MIYHLTLKTAGIIAGLVLILFGALALASGDTARNFATKFPRSRIAGIILLTIDLLWTFWLLATMEMGEFSTFRRPLLIALPIGFLLVLKFVDEFLSARALGILFLLAAEPLLEAAFLRYETSRLVVTVLAYLMIVLGLLWGTMPYLLRDQLNWSATSAARWRTAQTAILVLGGVLLSLAITRY